MKIDAQSLRELEIIGTLDARVSLFERLKATKTGGGEHRLQERFRAPLSSAEEIRRTQDAVRFLGVHAEQLTHVLNGSNWLVIEHYMSRHYSVLGHSRAWTARWDGLRIRLQHDSVFEQVRLGLSTLQSMIARIRELLEYLAGAHPPELLAEVCLALEDALAHPVLHRIQQTREVHRWRASEVLALDWQLRADEFRLVRTLARQVYELDSLRSLAIASRRLGCVLPRITGDASPSLRLKGLRHPFLREPVTNAVQIDVQQRLLFITGPNMAGKSTYLKSVALAVYMAHLGMGVPADHAEISVFDRLLTGIDTADAIAFGESYYFREVRRVRDAAGHVAAGERAFVIFDEMFRGTNLRDAAEGTACVVRGFLNFPKCAFVISSHIAEVAEGLREIDSVRLLHFSGELRESGISFDYRLRDGVSEQRLGMYFLEQQGVFTRLGIGGRSPDGAAAG